MKILLQRIRDRLYYQGKNAWTDDYRLAQAFRTTSEALECCASERLPSAQLVLKFEDSSLDISFPSWYVHRETGDDPANPKKPD